MKLSFRPFSENYFVQCFASRHHVEILKTDHAIVGFLTPPEIEGILKHWDLKERKIIDIHFNYSPFF